MSGFPTKLTATAIAGAGGLLAANDLSDVDDAGTSRTNLGLGTAAVEDADAFQPTSYTINAQVDSYTLALADAASLVTITKGTAVTLTVPPNADVAFPIGTNLLVGQLGAGQITLTPGDGVTINATPGLKISAQYGLAGLVKVATDVWNATGALAA